MDTEAEKVCCEFLTFIMHLKNWMEDHYHKEFNINGKNAHTLTDRQFQILISLHYMQLCTLSDLEEKLHISGSSLSIVISKLVQEGYIKRTYPEEGEDRRKTYLHLTEQGIAVLQEAYNRLMEVFKQFYQGLEEEKKKNLQQGIEKLSSVFKQS